MSSASASIAIATMAQTSTGYPCLRVCWAFPLGGLLGGTLVLIGGVLSLNGANGLNRALELDSRAILFVRWAYATIFLTSIPVMYRGFVAELRHLGYRSGFRRFCNVPGGGGLSALLTVGVKLLLWLCVIFSIPYVCIASSFFVVAAVSREICATELGDRAMLYNVTAGLLAYLNGPPIHAGLPADAASVDATLSMVCELELSGDAGSGAAEVPPGFSLIVEGDVEWMAGKTVLSFATDFLGGAIMLSLAVVVLLVQWTQYSKTWEFAEFGRARTGLGEDSEGVELRG